MTLLQEKWDDPWRILVSCILLNVTSRTQVDDVIERLFTSWPTATEMSNAYLWALEDRIHKLGLGHQRAVRLLRLSSQWAELETSHWRWPPEAEIVKELPGVGRYALDSYKIFVLHQNLDPYDVFDKELRAYLIERRRNGGQAGDQGGGRGNDHVRRGAGREHPVLEGHGRGL